MAHKLKKGMNVIVISGRDRGREGKILVIDRDEKRRSGPRVIVEGVNMMKRATKPNQKNQQGGMVEREASMHISNVAAVDPDSKTATRIRMSESGGRKIRIAARSGKSVE